MQNNIKSHYNINNLKNKTYSIFSNWNFQQIIKNLIFFGQSNNNLCKLTR